MQHDVKTPYLKKVAKKMSGLLDNLEDGTVQPTVAGRMIGAGNALTRAVQADVGVRLAAPRLAEIEAAAKAA